MQFSERMSAGRRLVILVVLKGAPEFTCHEYRLAELMAGDHGDAVGRDALRTELAWLEEQGLVLNQQTPQGLWISTLTVRGEDVATGRTVVPGVSRPRPEF